MLRQIATLAVIGSLILACSSDSDEPERIDVPEVANDQSGGSPATAFDLASRNEPLEPFFTNAFHNQKVIFAGKPTVKGFELARDQGAEVVVNLLTPFEQKRRVLFNEPRCAERLGMRYVSIPVAPENFTSEDVDAFAAVMDETEGKVLLHCASSNRSGALWAVYLARVHGLDADQALQHGRAAGLKSEGMLLAAQKLITAP